MSGDSRGRPLLNVRCGVCRDWLYEIDGEGATLCIPCRRAFEAGRLAAVRADVADFVGWCEREADSARGLALRLHDTLETTDYYPEAAASIREMRADMERWLGHADRHADKAADCRKWLEATS